MRDWRSYRSNLENKFYKNPSTENNKAYRKHKNYCSKLYKKERRNYYANLSHDNITDNKKFWKTVKPFLTDKGNSKQNIVLVQNENIISTDDSVAETINHFFSNAVSSLDIPNNPFLLSESNADDPISSIISKYCKHPSIVKIKEMIKPTEFRFKEVSHLEILNELNELNPKKSTPFKNIPIRLLKENTDICGTVLQNIINNEIKNNNFPDELKLADVTPIFKKGDKTNAKNYKPVSVLPPVSKVFKKILQKQMALHFNNYLSPYLCGYRKGYSAQHALLTLIENWKSILDKKGFGGAILMDLSKAFDTLNHELLMASAVMLWY